MILEFHREREVVQAFSSSASSCASSFTTSSTGAPLAERLAITPSFVTGVYAPPVYVNPHFRHFQTPTLSLLTLGKPHWGHLCGFFISVITLM